MQQGDTLYALALTYGVSVAEIMEANCLASTSLSAGRQELYLPFLPETPSPTSILAAPQLLAPSDRREFSENDEIVLAWQSMGELPPDTYYVISVAYLHLGETWYDNVPWTRSTSWTLSEHRYLLDLSDDGQFEWWVQLMRQTGVDAEGKPVGAPLSLSSEVRVLSWKRAAGGDGETPKGTPVVPPP